MHIIFLRIGTYNTRACDCGESIGLIAKDISGNNLDICGLQEIDISTKRSGGFDEMKLLAEYSGLKYSFFAKAMDFDGGEYGIGILSRFPFFSAEAAALPGKHNIEPRVIIQSVISLNGDKLNFFNTHLALECAGLRRTQIKKVLDMLSAVKGKAVLTGDFNVDAYNEFDNFTADFRLANSHVTLYDTFKLENQRFNGIDNIIVSKTINMLGTKLVDTAASDHRLLIADVEI